jgi:hypothetical protein
VTGNQRWRDGAASYRCPDETIDTSAHEVVELLDDTTPRTFVEQHHYSGSYPAARFRFGLYERSDLVGVAVFSVPARDEVITNVFPTLPVSAGVELGRFVLLDRVAGNGETWFLARCFELLRQQGPVLPKRSKARQRQAGDVRGIVSFSDPCPRTTVSGDIVMPGHVGTIYQASNAIYLGRGRADNLRLLPDGRVLARRTYQKIRDGERGWIPAAQTLQGYGAHPISVDADERTRRAWLDTWMARLTRPMPHAGNHRYAWVIDKGERNPPRRSTAGYAMPLGPYLQTPKTIDSINIRFAA